MRKAFLFPVAASLALVAHAPASDEWKRWAEAPATPGSIAALMLYRDEPAVHDLWTSALRDPKAEVRAAAARAILSASVGRAVEPAAAALAAETEPNAAIELVQLLVYLADGAKADAAILDAAKRIPAIRRETAELLGAGRGEAALAHLSAFAGMDPEGWVSKELAACGDGRRPLAHDSRGHECARGGQRRHMAAVPEARPRGGIHRQRRHAGRRPQRRKGGDPK